MGRGSTRWSVVVGVATVVVAALCLLQPAHAAVDQTPYTPSSSVEQYHRFEFELTGEYALKVAKVTVIPVAVVGLLVTITFLIWSCCACCGNCKPGEMQQSTKHLLFAAALGLTVACVAMLMYGFKADAKQSDAFQQVPELIDNLIEWQDSAVADVQRVLDQVVLMLGTIDDIEAADPSGTYTNLSLVSEIEAARSSAQSASDELDQLVADINLASVRNKFGDDVDNVDDKRHTAVIVSLALLLVFTLIQLALSVLAMYARARWVAFVQPVVTTIFVLLIFIVWLVCGVLYGTSVFFADFCVNPDSNLLRVTDNQNDDTLRYYLECDSNATLQDPLASDRESATSALDEAKTLIAELQAEIDCSGQGTDCTDVEALVDELATQVNAAIDALDDVIAHTNCESLNGLYQAVLNTMCDSGFEALQRFFEVLIAMACIMVLAEILRRCLPRKHDTAIDPQYNGGIDGYQMYSTGGSTAAAKTDPEAPPPDYAENPAFSANPALQHSSA